MSIRTQGCYVPDILKADTDYFISNATLPIRRAMEELVTSIFCPEDEGDMFHRNVGNHLQVHSVAT